MGGGMGIRVKIVKKEGSCPGLRGGKAAAVVSGAALVLLGTAVEAQAYIDPSTGGYSFQILFSLVSAVSVVLLFFKRHAVSILKKVARWVVPKGEGLP